MALSVATNANLPKQLFTEVLTWIDAGNTAYAWDGSSYYNALAGRQGFFAPSTSIIEQETPLVPGASLRFVKTTSRQLKVPLLVKAADERAFTSVRRTLAFALNPNRGDGTLQVSAADGSVRQMTARCEAGREGDEAIPARFLGGYIFPLQFRALDPYWYDAAFTSVSKSSFPVTFTITNGGDEQTWPIWTITGPLTAITLTNNSSGKAMTLTATLANSSQTITVDTRPVQEAPTSGKTVVREDGSAHFSYLSTASSLWPLLQGANGISISVTGSGAGTSVNVQYKQAYDGC